MSNSPRFLPANIRSGGFTLLEILVAFTLMALAVSVLMRVFSGGLQGAGIAEDYARATSIAESKLAAVGAEMALKEGSTSGTDSDRYRWTVRIAPYEIAPANQDQPPQPQALMTVQPLQVVVAVSWNDYGKDREVVLSSLRLGPRT